MNIHKEDWERAEQKGKPELVRTTNSEKLELWEKHWQKTLKRQLAFSFFSL